MLLKKINEKDIKTYIPIIIPISNELIGAIIDKGEMISYINNDNY